MIKPLLAFTAAAAAISTLSGCALLGNNTAPLNYLDGYSRAYNIARAGGLITDIRDTRVPADATGSAVTTALDAGFVGAGFMTPKLGMTNWQTLGAGLLSVLAKPDSHGARNSMIAWMPVDEASDPVDAKARMLAHAKSAVERSLDEMGIPYTYLYETDDLYWTQIIHEPWGCPVFEKGVTKWEDICRVEAKVFQPRWRTAPAYIAGQEEPRYRFYSGDDYQYHSLSIRSPKGGQVPEDVLYLEISRRLPDWTYLYIAPGDIQTAEGATINYPVLLNQGKVELFIKPEKG